jgi:hypothetical protein
MTGGRRIWRGLFFVFEVVCGDVFLCGTWRNSTTEAYKTILAALHLFSAVVIAFAAVT